MPKDVRKESGKVQGSLPTTPFSSPQGKPRKLSPLLPQAEDPGTLLSCLGCDHSLDCAAFAAENNH